MLNHADIVQSMGRGLRPEQGRSADAQVIMDRTLGGTSDTSPEQGKRPARRGTSNGNQRGGSDARARRRAWLVQTYRADRDVIAVLGSARVPVLIEVLPGTERAQPACRCYRCGLLLTVDTVTVDRIVPGCRGGTYARNNIRPACGTCNSSTGATVRRK